jgi:rubrerythrin
VIEASLLATSMAKEPPLDQLRSVLRLIRGRADYALDLLKQSDEVRALSWRCLVCGHTKKFTRPVPRDVAIPCPKCHGSDLVAD